MNKRTNEEWLTNLRSDGEEKEAALQDLRETIIASLPYALSKWIDHSDPRFSPLAEEVSQDTILRVMDRLDTFEGRSQFTTWVYTIAVRVALTELRRAKWKDVSLEEFLKGRESNDEPREVPDQKTNVESSIEKKEMMAMLQDVMKSELTPKQRMALMAVAVHGMPMEEIARRMGTERNALYKLLHDARIKLKRHLGNQGITAIEILAAFEE